MTTNQIIMFFSLLCCVFICGFFVVLFFLLKSRGTSRENGTNQTMSMDPARPMDQWNPIHSANQTSFASGEHPANPTKSINSVPFDDLGEMGNRATLEADCKTIENLDGCAIVSIRLRHLAEFYDLFGIVKADKIFDAFCHNLRAFAAEHHGKCYRITFDYMSLLVRVEDKNFFLDRLQGFMQKSERLDLQIEDVPYQYYFSLPYGVYFLSAANDGEVDLMSILTHLDQKIWHTVAKSTTAYVVMEEKDKPNWAERRELEAEVQDAWKNHEFVPYYQPTFNVETGKMVDSEILARWQHPSRGLLLPSQFVSILERQGLIFDLDLYMIEMACQKIQGWLNQGILTVPLAVNVSALNIHRGDFIEKLTDLVTKYDVPPTLLELQLPDGKLLFENNEVFVSKMNDLHKKGFSLSMDRFAESPTSALWLMQRLPLGTINVDQQFFANIQDSQRGKIYVRNFLKLAQDLHIKIVVTHLETAEQVELVRSFGCTNCKGFYFSKPLSNDEFQESIS